MNLDKLKRIRYFDGSLSPLVVKRYPLLRLINWLRFRLEIWVIQKLSTKHGIRHKEAFADAVKNLHEKQRHDIVTKKLNVALQQQVPRLTAEEKYSKGRRDSAALVISPEERVKWSNDRIFKVYGDKKRSKYRDVRYRVEENFKESRDGEEKN